MATFYAEITKATVNEVRVKSEGDVVDTVPTLAVGLESTDGDVDAMRKTLAEMMKTIKGTRVVVSITLEQQKLGG